MIDELMHMYENGGITADHLVLELLHKLDPAEPVLVLQFLPRAVLLRMAEYANRFRPGDMRTNYGFQPAPDQVSAAKQWIEENVLGANDEDGLLRSNCAKRL